MALIDREVAFNQQINALVPKQIDGIFLFVQLKVGKKLIQQASTGGMKGIVSKSRLESVRILSPPSDLQKAFAAQFRCLEEVRVRQIASLSELDTLFASLQYSAFRGEL